jgi:transitional endoplasmic reticulum ATPase
VVPSGLDRRFGLLQRLSRKAIGRARELIGRPGESFRSGWYETEKNSHRPVRARQGDYRHIALWFVCLPITILIIAEPLSGLFSRTSILIIALFLVWVVRAPLRGSSTVVRKLAKILILSLLVADYISLIGSSDAAGMFGAVFGHRKDAGGWILMTGMLSWWVGVLWIALSREKLARHRLRAVPSGLPRGSTSPAQELRIPTVRFANVGGMEEAKQQIGEVVESRLNPQKYAAYGVNRNGILLYGPRGSGKTFLAEATAGEFGLNFHYISPTKLTTMWVGGSEASIRGAFNRALGNRPALLFIDEIDSLGSVRQSLGAGGDPGGAGRSYNNMAIELMQSIDQTRTEPGLIVMAATNFIDALDEALIREGRFDVKIHVDLPDEATREAIFRAQLSAKPWAEFDLRSFARRTPGASAAKIRSLIDQAAVFAAREGRKIEVRDVERALQESGGKDRPLFQPVEWEDVIVEERVEQELRSLIRLVANPFAAERMRLRAPMGLLLLGPPGTGKTLIARLIATQSKRSFLPITSAEITDPKAVSRVFARARENSPSLIFMDEMDSLVPANPGYLNQYYVQLVEQFLIEISALQPEHNVFLVGTTNHPENIDPRVLRGGRLSEKIEIGLPGPKEVGRLLAKYLKGVEFEPSLTLNSLTEWLTGTIPANLEAMVSTAMRYAFERSGDDRLAPLNLEDFERAAQRVMGQAPPLRASPATQA